MKGTELPANVPRYKTPVAESGSLLLSIVEFSVFARRSHVYKHNYISSTGSRQISGASIQSLS